MIVHPTDYAPDGALALAHAVRLAIRSKHTLSLLNIAKDDLGPRRDGLRIVADLLVKWGALPGKSGVEALSGDLGLNIVSVGVPVADMRATILDYIQTHPCEIGVLSTRDHRGLNRWLERSVVKRALKAATTLLLMVRHGSRGFVNAETGELKLERVLAPVDDPLDAELALKRLQAWLQSIGAAPEIRLLHVGAPMAPIGGYTMIQRDGAVTEAIFDVARRWSPDLIAMPTTRHSGLISALRGSVTSKLLDDARWAVLSVPASAPAPGSEPVAPPTCGLEPAAGENDDDAVAGRDPALTE